MVKFGLVRDAWSDSFGAYHKGYNVINGELVCQTFVGNEDVPVEDGDNKHKARCLAMVYGDDEARAFICHTLRIKWATIGKNVDTATRNGRILRMLVNERLARFN
jgi:hypothetical protein